MPRTQPQSALEPQLQNELDADPLEGDSDPTPEQAPQSRFMNVDELEARLWRWRDAEEFFILMRSITFMSCIAVLAIVNPFQLFFFGSVSPLEQFLTHGMGLLFLILGLLDIRQYRSHEKMRRHVFRLANTSRHFALGLTMFAICILGVIGLRQPRFLIGSSGYNYSYVDLWWIGVILMALGYGTMSLYRAYQVKKLRELEM